MLFLLPLLAVGIFALVGRHASTAHEPAPARVAAAPSPFLVLDGFVRAGKQPPPFVVQCAIAEAELAGRMDIVTDLVRTFVEPIVREAEDATIAQIVRPMAYAVNDVLDAPAASALAEARATGTSFEHVVDRRIDQAVTPMLEALAAAPSRSTDPRAWTNDEAAIAAALEAMEHPEMGTQIIPSDQLASPPPPRAESPIVTVAGAMPQTIPHVEHVDHVQAPAASFARMLESSSPIPNLSAERFHRFADALSRESVAFDGPRHVGMFRARKDRLVELGIDPVQLVGDPAAQFDALCIDMADAFMRARGSGMLRQHGKRAIDLGAKMGGVHTITASGIMGVIAAAGLEGAADWLDNPSDRDRFPHTTAVFVRTNGVF